MSQSISNPPRRASFASLDQHLRRNVFGFLNIACATKLALACPDLADEIGSVAFETYRAVCPLNLLLFLIALLEVPEFSPWVRTVVLSSPFDEVGHSGFYEWMLELADITLSPGHLGTAVQHIGFQFEQRCDLDGAFMDDTGRLQGWQHWPSDFHNRPLIGSILPALCPNVEVVEMPAAWGAPLEQMAWASFANIREVRMA
tara:strand:+ start:12568 stop:13170 length:603 start_codon:yes stop_codon:yes gene_type:complete